MPVALIHREKRRGIFDAGETANDDVIPTSARHSADALSLMRQAVEGNPLFDNLSAEEQRRLLNTMTPLSVPDRTVLIHQGDPQADTFYIVTSGTCVAYRDGISVKEYQAGGSFGELSLLFSKPRAATVTCTSDCALMVMRRSIYNAVRNHDVTGVEARYATLLRRAPELERLSDTTRSELFRGLKEVTVTRGAAMPRPGEGLCWVLGGCGVAASGARVVPPNHYGSLMRTEEGAEADRFKALTDTTCLTLSRSVVHKLLGPPEQLELFDTLRVMPILYPLDTGQLFALARAVRRQSPQTLTAGRRMSAQLLYLQAGELGELARGGDPVLAGTCVSGAVRAAVDSVVCSIDEAVLERLVGLKAAVRDWRMRAVRGLPELADLSAKQARAICDSLCEHRLPAGTEVVRSGEELPGCFIIQSGVCRMGKVDLGPGAHFGGWAMLGRKAPDTLTAITDVVLLPVEPAAVGVLQYAIPPLQDLQFVHELGAGSYGHVMLVRCAASRPFALKRLDKVQLKAAHMAAHVTREKVLHSQCSSDFVTRMFGSYNRGQYLYMLMECVSGGDLYTHMKKMGPMSEGRARFYVACVVCGLDHLHARNIAWRDLKPENLLVDDIGYLKVTDLGFACTLRLGQRTRTLCGTTEYIAPEIIMKSGHTKAVDWWALGVLIYELVAGRTPFVNSDGHPGSGMRVFHNICRVQYSMPPHFSPGLKDLVRRLLDQDPVRRLCSGVAGAIEIKEHAWFAGFDWGALQSRTMHAPFIPSEQSPTLVTSLSSVLQEKPTKYSSAGDFSGF